MPAVFWGQQIVYLRNKSVLYACTAWISSHRVAAGGPWHGEEQSRTSDRYYFWQRIIISAGRISEKEESNYYKPSGLTSCLVISSLCSVISVSNLSIVRTATGAMSSTTGPSRNKGWLGGGCRDRGRFDTLREYSPYAVPMRNYTRAYLRVFQSHAYYYLYIVRTRSDIFLSFFNYFPRRAIIIINGTHRRSSMEYGMARLFDNNAYRKRT